MQLCQRWELPGFDYPGGDALSAEALEDLAFAPTVLTAEILLDQVHGALRAEIARLAVLVLQEPTVARARLDAIIGAGATVCDWFPGGRWSLPGDRTWGRAACSMRFVVFLAQSSTLRRGLRETSSFSGPRSEAGLLYSPIRRGSAGRPTRSKTSASSGRREELEAADLVLLVLDRSESLRPIDRQLIATIAGAPVVANKSRTWSSLVGRRYRPSGAERW